MPTVRTFALLWLWIVLSILVVPLYMFSPQELAPTEDQGGVFTSLDVPANASLDQLLACVDWIAPGFEIVQSHLADWRFAAADTVADGALHAPPHHRRRSSLIGMAVEAILSDRPLQQQQQQQQLQQLQRQQPL